MASRKVIDLDAGLLAACSGPERDEVFGEALMLADAFAPDGGAAALLAMAQTLAVGDGGERAERRHARRLAAALRALAAGDAVENSAAQALKEKKNKG